MLISNLRNMDSSFREVFNFKEDRAKGRSCMILSILVANVYSHLINGIFFTGFLLETGINMVDIGYVTSIPLLCSFFGIFTPAILSRFKKRKAVLCATRFAFFAINILGITFVPILDVSLDVKKGLIVIIIFIANSINQIFASGFATWHFHFLPDDIRPKFFSYQQIIGGLTSFFTLLISGLLTDAVSASGGNKLPIMITLRIVAFFVSIIDVIVLMIPREYEYKTSSDKVHLFAIFIDPFKYKGFLKSMVIVSFWSFSSYLSLTSFEVYVLNELNVSYTVINTINAFYGWFIFLIVPLWRNHTLKHGWHRTFKVTAIPNALTYFIALFVAPFNSWWLYPIYRLIQHATGVGYNFSYANIAYVNLPETDRTSCLSFHMLVVNISAFLGQICGTTIVSATQGLQMNILGFPFNNVKLVVLVQCIVNVLFVLYICKFTKKPIDAYNNEKK